MSSLCDGCHRGQHIHAGCGGWGWGGEQRLSNTLSLARRPSGSFVSTHSMEELGAAAPEGPALSPVTRSPFGPGDTETGLAQFSERKGKKEEKKS